MYSKTPPLPPPIPNEPPPPSFHPPLPTQPPPSLFQNAAMPVYPLQPRPPATFSNFGYQQQPQLSPYQSMHPQLRVDHQRFNQPKPLFEQSPRPLFDHTRSIHPLMQQSQPLMQQSQPLMQQSQPLMQQSQSLMQQSQPLMQQSQPLLQQSQPLMQQSQPLMQQSQPLVQQSQPLMQQSQPLVQQSQSYNLELRKQTSYQEPSSESSNAGPKPLMDIRPCVPESLSTGEDLGQNVDIARSSEQFSASDAAAINNGNTIVHPVPCHIASQHQRRTLLPGKPNQWIPLYSSYPSEQDSSSRFDSHSIDYGHSARFDEYQTPEIEEESDHHQPSYHSEPADESNVNRTPIQTVSADVLFGNSDQRTRPTHFVIVLRGLPGSGKSYVAKVIKEKEISNGFSTPRILNLDDYFLVEVEKKVKDPLSGKKVKKKEMEYEYDAAMEEQYRANLFKSFNKTLSDGYFPVIIIDTINHKVSHFYQYWSTAKVRGFEVYVCELDVDVDKCAERNVHKRSLNEIKEIKEEWEEAPPHILRLDISSLLNENSDTAIDEVEMGGVGTENSLASGSRVDQWIKQQEEDQSSTVKSKWEDLSLTGEEKLDQLDGFSRKRKRSSSHTEGSEMTLTDYLSKQEKLLRKPGKKQVRWADLEAKKEEELQKEIGFHIGGKWTKITDEEAAGLLHGDDTT